MFPIFPPDFTYALTFLSAGAGVVFGVYLLVRGRARGGATWFVAYCTGLLALVLQDHFGIESLLAMFSTLIWLAITFGMMIWSQRRHRSGAGSR